jgi:hypothetical protein
MNLPAKLIQKNQINENRRKLTAIYQYFNPKQHLANTVSLSKTMAESK